MMINQLSEITMLLDNDHFQKALDWASTKSGYLGEHGKDCNDLSMTEKGTKSIYRTSQYKKKVRLIVNTGLLLGDSPISGDKMKPKANLDYTDADDVPGEIIELTRNSMAIFTDTFARVVPFGNFIKRMRPWRLSATRLRTIR